MIYTLSTIAAGICWGTISLFIKPLNALGLSPFQILAFRTFFSCLIMLVIILIKNPKLLKISFKDLWMFLGTGVISLTLFSLCYFTTMIQVSVSVAVILLYTSPIFVTVLSLILFKEKLNVQKVTALILTFGGCILVSGVGNSSNISIWRFLIGLGAGLFYSLYSIFSRFALQKYDSLTVTFYTFLFSCLTSLPFCNIGSAISMVNGINWLLVIGVAIVGTVLPYIFYTFGLSGLETGKAAIIVTIEPLVACLVGFFVWKEDVSLTKILGILLIFASIILLEIKFKNKK